MRCMMSATGQTHLQRQQCAYRSLLTALFVVPYKELPACKWCNRRFATFQTEEEKKAGSSLYGTTKCAVRREQYAQVAWQLTTVCRLDALDRHVIVLLPSTVFSPRCDARQQGNAAISAFAHAVISTGVAFIPIIGGALWNSPSHDIVTPTYR
jgi:hypothetical protein